MEHAASDGNNNNNNRKERIQFGRVSRNRIGIMAICSHCGAERKRTIQPKSITSHISSDYFMISFVFFFRCQLRERRDDACCENRISRTYKKLPKYWMRRSETTQKCACEIRLSPRRTKKTNALKKKINAKKIKTEVWRSRIFICGRYDAECSINTQISNECVLMPLHCCRMGA